MPACRDAGPSIAERAAAARAAQEAADATARNAGRAAREVRRLADRATALRIEVPVMAGGTRTAAFEVPGLDSSKMPGW